MIADSVDWSFLGVFGIWNNDIGKPSISKNCLLADFAVSELQRSSRISEPRSEDKSIAGAVERLAENLQLPELDTTSSSFPFHRQLCLHTCGLGSTSQQLESSITELVNEKQNTQAALLALIHGNFSLASNALRRGKASLVHRELSLALAGYVKGNTDDIWDETVREVAKEMDDPYARGILAFTSYGDWHDVLTETSLPLRYRVAIGLLYFEDEELTNYIGETTQECIQQGDIEGIALTGLSEQSVKLFNNYMMKFSDLQTPILALSFTCPRYFSSPMVDLWRDVYRSQLNSYRLFTQRVQFDVQATKLSLRGRGKNSKPALAPASRQVSLKCSNCDSALDRNPDNMPSPELESSLPTTGAFGPTQRTSIFGDVKSGTICPKCGRHMPRCVICMMWLVCRMQMQNKWLLQPRLPEKAYPPSAPRPKTPMSRGIKRKICRRLMLLKIL